MHVSCHKVTDLSSETYKQLYRLNFRGGSHMQRKLSAARKRKIKGYAIICRNNEGIILGWALLWQGLNDAGIIKPVVYFYVRCANRQQGVASRLMYCALRCARDYFSTCIVGVWAHDETACSFFDKFGDRVEMYW